MLDGSVEIVFENKTVHQIVVHKEILFHQSKISGLVKSCVEYFSCSFHWSDVQQSISIGGFMEFNSILGCNHVFEPHLDIINDLSYIMLGTLNYFFYYCLIHLSPHLGRYFSRYNDIQKSHYIHCVRSFEPQIIAVCSQSSHRLLLSVVADTNNGSW